MVGLRFDVQSEVEVPGIAKEGGARSLGPLEGEDPGGLKEIFEKEVVEIGGILKAVGVAVDELSFALVNEIEIKTGATNGFADAETPGEPAHESGLPGTEIAVKGENGVVGQGAGQGLSERLGFLR